MPPEISAVLKKIEDIEAEMKRSGFWQDEPLPEEKYTFQQAFGADTMTFPQWLQFVLVSRVHQIIAEKGNFPNSSMVAVQAAAVFADNDKVRDLIKLLAEFDALFNRVPPMSILFIPPGAQVMIGAPAQPMPDSTMEALKNLVGGIPEITEAHLPQLIAPAVMQAPGQVLVTVMESQEAADRALAALDAGITKILGEDGHLDVLALAPSSPLLGSVRNIGLRIK
jgi:uncharacterized protein YqcC (DUF446 family)